MSLGLSIPPPLVALPKFGSEYKEESTLGFKEVFTGFFCCCSTNSRWLCTALLPPLAYCLRFRAFKDLLVFRVLLFLLIF